MGPVLPFVYQYTVGGLIFFAGLYLGWRSGYLGLQTRSQMRNLTLLVLGFFALAGFQGYLQFVAPTHPHLPIQGEPLPTLSVGTPLDYGIMVLYFVIIITIGAWFGRYNRSTRDFFFGGQKFTWWFITFSLVATTVGSYSFIKYSRVAFNFGISSSQTYLNDWFWVPLFLFGWLPIIFFSKVISIPEYFERRFGRLPRMTVTGLLLVYLIGYVGINLYTMGTALNALLGWSVFNAACVVGAVSALYVTWGGQTSVIVTDLFQGVMLLVAGGLILFLGIQAVGGVDAFWTSLPPEHRMAFSDFNSEPSFPMVGIFWQDAIANTAVFYFLNQGVMMRFLSVKNVNEGKKAIFATAIILMPIAAIVVASGGWVGSALEQTGLFVPSGKGDHVFVEIAKILCAPGVFGLVMAALTAALMSTVDTLITAVAAIGVNDIWKPYVSSDREDGYYLRVARYTSVAVALIGIGLVPIFSQFDSIYSAHGAFTAAVTPPLVVAFLLALLWPRYTSAGVFATVAGGFGLVLVSIFIPELVEPFSHGIPTTKADGTELVGAKAHKFTRALFGLVASAILGIVVSLLTKPREPEEIKGLTQHTSSYLANIGANKPSTLYTDQPRTKANVANMDISIDAATGQPLVALSAQARTALNVGTGDTFLISDTRWWFGGLRSLHATVSEDVLMANTPTCGLNDEFRKRVMSPMGDVQLERII